MIKFIKRLFCKHDYKHVRDFYGDEVISHGWNRSEWRCTKCGKVIYGRFLKETYEKYYEKYYGHDKKGGEE